MAGKTRKKKKEVALEVNPKRARKRKQERVQWFFVREKVLEAIPHSLPLRESFQPASYQNTSMACPRIAIGVLDGTTIAFVVVVVLCGKGRWWLTGREEKVLLLVGGEFQHEERTSTWDTSWREQKGEEGVTAQVDWKRTPKKKKKEEKEKEETWWSEVQHVSEKTSQNTRVHVHPGA